MESKKKSDWSKLFKGVEKLKVNHQNRLHILTIVGDHFGYSVEELLANTRKEEIRAPRQISHYFYRQFTSLSLVSIGEIHRGMDHASVLHSCRVVLNSLETDYRSIRSDISAISYKIKQMIKTGDGSRLIVYISHPIAGDKDKNIKAILSIVYAINIFNQRVIPFVPYLADCMALDDTDPDQRDRGISNGLEILSRREAVDELWIYGDKITDGMTAEIKKAWTHGIPIKPMTEAMKLAYEAFLIHNERKTA